MVVPPPMDTISPTLKLWVGLAVVTGSSVKGSVRSEDEGSADPLRSNKADEGAEGPWSWVDRCRCRERRHHRPPQDPFHPHGWDHVITAAMMAAARKLRGTTASENDAVVIMMRRDSVAP